MNKNKKILHLTPTDIRYDSRIIKELKSLEKLEMATILAFGIDDDEGHKYELKPMPYVRTFNLISKKINFLPRPVKYFLNLLEAIVILSIPAIKYKPQIIHCHDTLYLPIALLVKMFCKSELIYDAHELESQKYGQSVLLSKTTLLIEKISWRYIDVLITVSPSIIDWYQKNLGNKESLLMLNSPELKLENFDAISNNYLREKFNIPENCKIFIYLGIIGKGRGIDLYLDIFQEPEINSHIVFIGYGEYTNKVQSTSLKHKNIHYHSAVKHDDVVEIAQSADVGLVIIEEVSLSCYYCLPNKLFEYAFSGLYVLASNFPDMEKIVKDYNLGIVCSVDSESIKKAIIELEHLKIDRSTKDLHELSWSSQSDKLINLYKGLLNH